MEAGRVVAEVIENAASEPQGEPGSGDVFKGAVLSCSDLVKDEALAKAPEERQPQETAAPMMRSSEASELQTEPLLRSCVSTASMKVKNIKKLTFPRGHFPRLAECAHFHYETVDFGSVQLSFAEEQGEVQKAAVNSKELVFLVQICCQSRSWLVKRSYEDFRVLDKHLHLCIYDRRFSQLTELPRHEALTETSESVNKMLATYLSRFSAIADNKINCGPVLTWMETDNKGNHLLVSEEASINVPAIAAAHVTKRYTAQAADELTFEVGDIVSVIDMPPKEDTGWWRGKHGFQVGFFPSDCVEVINDKVPTSVESSVPKPVCKKHGKLVTFLRTFMKSRPPPQKLRQRGILKERVFGCDLGEHLHNSGYEVPQVIRSCAEFIEKHGVVDGIYRLSGISSNIQKLRHEFDSEQVPDLTRDVFRQDIHSVGSLCKLYFRELPNPLLTYQLYEGFSEAVSATTDEERLAKIHNVIQQLPPPHYRTLEYLARHLTRLATFSPITNMHTKNLAIVWAPNLLRSRQIESACFSGTAAFMEVRIQSVVVEFILNNTEALFSSKLNAVIRESAGNHTLSRPKSLLVCSPSTKLLSLEEAQARTQAQLGSPATPTPTTPPCLTHSDYIEVGEGPGALLGKFHTVIDLPPESKRASTKAKKSPVGNWLSFFHLGKSHSVSKRKLKRHPSEPNAIKSIALPGGRGHCSTLRSTKSEESLTSLHNMEESPDCRLARPRSTSGAFLGANADRLQQAGRGGEGAGTPLLGETRGESTLASVRSPDDDLDLCPPAPGMSTLDFDPMSFQCSPSCQQHARERRSDTGAAPWDASLSPGPRKKSFKAPEPPPLPLSSPPRETPKRENPRRENPRRETHRKKETSRNEENPRKKETPRNEETPKKETPRNEETPKKETPRNEETPKKETYQHCSPGSSASGLIDGSQPAQNLPDPGAHRPVSSVCVLPPRPPTASAARQLALALAQSAHRRSRACGSGVLPCPERPARPSILHLPSRECRGVPRSHSVSPQSPRTRPDVSSGRTPTVSPSRAHVDAADPPGVKASPGCHSVGVSTPTGPSCSLHSPARAFDFRSVLAEASVPSSLGQVLPRPPAEQERPPAYPRLLFWGRTPPHRDATPPRLGPAYTIPEGPARPSSPWQHPQDSCCCGWQGRTGHTALRRARSFHGSQGSHGNNAADLPLLPPPPDSLFYYTRLPPPGCRGATYRWPSRADYPHGQAYVERGAEGCSPYRDPAEALCYPEPCRPWGMSHSQSYSPHFSRESQRYHWAPSRETLADSMECQPYGYEAAEADVYGRLQYQEGGEDETAAPFLSPGGESMHAGSRPGPENACLLSATGEQQSGGEAVPGRRECRRIYIQEVPSPSSPQQQQQPPWLHSVPDRGYLGHQSAEYKNRSYARGREQDRIVRDALRRPSRSQSIKEDPRHHRYHAEYSMDTQPTRRTHSTRVRPTHYDHMEGYYQAPGPEAVKSGEAGYFPSHGCMTPHRQALLSKALGHRALIHHVGLRSEAGVYE